jgi:hypothetical protein
VRKLAASTDRPPAAEEGKALLARIERYVQNRLSKAEEEPANVVERVALYQEIADQFEGDEIAQRARRKIAEVEAACELPQEREAYELYQDARADFRALPPAGTYAYSMAYALTRDPVVLATRRRIFTEFRLEMKGIDEDYPRTYAASKAIEALTYHTPPVMDPSEAKAKLRAAAGLVRQTDNPQQIYEGLLQLEEVLDGYPATDDITNQAVELCGRTRTAQAPQLLEGRRVYNAAKRSVREIMAEEGAEGSGLSKDELQNRISRLEAIVRAAGAGSYLEGLVKSQVIHLQSLGARALKPKAAEGRPGGPTGGGARP